MVTIRSLVARIISTISDNRRRDEAIFIEDLRVEAESLRHDISFH